MDAKLLVITLYILAVMMAEPIAADFFYNANRPSANNLDELGLKCIPGRTVIKITSKEVKKNPDDEDYSDENGLQTDTRRKHMNVQTKDEYCRICVCSVDGRNEYCSNRPAANVNECLLMIQHVNRFQKNQPFDHEKSLSNRIRRDYIWNNDEIPYDSKAACRRGHSYYSNSISANDTDIDVGTDIESLLDYANTGICFYCVCSVHGRDVGCISRNPWFCEYYRFLRTPGAGRDMYRNLFEQDRPTYFRLLSHRLRRTMDDGIFDFIDSGGDALCCGHQDGHRRQIHNSVKNKLRLLKKKLPKENLLGGGPRGDYEDFIVNNDLGNGVDKRKCVPFVSQYTDCTDENVCSGCTKCTCTAEGQWSCDSVQECDEEDRNDMEYDVNDDLIENALKTVEMEMKNKRIREAKSSYNPLVPTPMKKSDRDLLLENFKIYDPMEEIIASLRQKRSIKENKVTETNDTVKFFGVVDELNEDTLKNSNVSGTLQAQRIESVNLPNLSRRTGVLDNTNTSLQIEFSEPHRFNHITDNNIDVTGHIDATFDETREKLNSISNNTQETKDKELSKLVVNELKKSSEIIGDAAAPVISNITFTPENDTFSAMAFIAGNLLNKLWNIEKDAGGTSIETEVIKHEKIANLLDLFKEPLTLKQETFLKNALAQLSSAIDKNKDNIKNMSFCENIEEAKKFLEETSKSSEDNLTDEKKERKGCKNGEKKEEEGHIKTEDAISKVHNVMALIQKFDSIQKQISGLEINSETDSKKEEKAYSSTLKQYSRNNVLTNDEGKSLHKFQTLLGKITGILYPKHAPNKQSNINNGNKENIKNKLKMMYDIDPKNINVTSKDKIIFDYLSHIEANPECLLKTNNRQSKTRTLANIEGNILLNLSEFFKIKSFSDLVKLLEPKPSQVVHKSITTTEKIVESTTETEKVTTNISPVPHKESSKLETTKDKLKAHLKTILEDLIEIQHARGVNTKNISLVDALPCIYNILNADKEIPFNKTKTIDPADKVAVIFNELKADLKTVQTRRNDIIVGPRPKSAIVWERTIKALNKNTKPKSRRTLGSKTRKSFEEIKRITETIESAGSNTYKNYALLVDVPAADKLVLLRTLEADVRTYIKALEEIKLSIDQLDKLPTDKQLELIEFIGNSATHINLDDKVVNNLNKPKQRRYLVAGMNSSRDAMRNNIMKQTVKDDEINKSNNNMRLSRDLIINQLIKNRIQLYMRVKQAKGLSLDDDMNYNIAQKILIFLESDNYQLARELYKVFVTRNTNLNNDDRSSNNRFYNVSPLLKLKEELTPMSMQLKRPLIQFQEQKTPENPLKWLNQDNLIKQLLNIRNMSG